METLREEIVKSGAVSSGALSNFTYDVHADTYALRIEVNLPEYYKYLNEGVNGLQDKHGSQYSFRYMGVSQKMADALVSWLKFKSILPRSRVTGRFITRRAGAYAIGMGLKKHGIRPRNFMAEAKKRNEQTIKELKRMVIRGLTEDILTELKTN